MRRYFSHIIIALLGAVIGGLGTYFYMSKRQSVPLEKVKIVEKVKNKIIHDTIQVERIIKQTMEPMPADTLFDSTQNEDTLNVLSDSLFTSENEETEKNHVVLEEEDVAITEEDILTEKLIEKIKVPIITIPVDSNDVEVLLEVKGTPFAATITVEFWESPLDLVGYQLSRNRLKLFGFNPHETIQLQELKEEQLNLTSETLDLRLSKTTQFKSIRLK